VGAYARLTGTTLHLGVGDVAQRLEKNLKSRQLL
jgi:hypothetical protein